MCCCMLCSAAGEGASQPNYSPPRPTHSGTTVAPTFTSAFADRVVFVNTAGAMLPCTAAGRPAPTVQWVWADSRQPVSTVPRLVEPLGNGSLRFLAFADARYNEDVHSAVSLRCQATNDVGTVVSKLVRVRAGQFCFISTICLIYVPPERNPIRTKNYFTSDYNPSCNPNLMPNLISVISSKWKFVLTGVRSGGNSF